ncbi:helix-turn-helix domain-containing protein [Pontibacter anaerobius]|uniref:Helix-turn-helix domain-containing protein n=1 Tax=Pontibacter anaerobius TaxID=2993940 RepID=A0ABT3RA62_9BACT|nr:helix-turn-helix domain-containing protein [Pontibacter anaerobius]MCX2738387.1 helix-turn-helix domain-containing protein [Pontibacter anaerobius]
MKQKQFPVYCIEEFPSEEKERDNVFYMTRLETLVKQFENIDKPHSHTFYLVMMVTEGTGTHTIDFVTHQIEPPQLFFLTPGQVHSWNLSPDIKGISVFFEANFFLQHYPQRLYQYPFFHSQQHKPLLALPADDFWPDLMNCMYHEYERQLPHRNEVLLSYLHITLENAARLYRSETFQDKAPGAVAKVREFELLLNQHFLQKREVKDYADMLHITPNHLNVLCKSTVGKTASQLIHERVIVEAQRLLLHSTLSIKEIAYKLHFDDNSYFSRFFKKYSGKTPEQFRKVEG